MAKHESQRFRMRPALTMREEVVTVFGGSGFVGRYVVNQLASRGYRVRIAVRRPHLAVHLQPLGFFGQVQTVQANLRYPESIARALEGATYAVNCVGILFEGGKQSFSAVQDEGARHVAEAARNAGVSRLVHISAIGADEDSISAYARSKAAGERAVLSAMPRANILRPSIIFGPEDKFFNKFASLSRYLPFLPLIGGGHTRFQPIYANDVAHAVLRCLEGKAEPGVIYELGGPQIKTFRQLMEIIANETGRKRLLIPVPFWAAKLKAAFLHLFPNPILTIDQVQLLQYDNIVSEKALQESRALTDLNITPTPLAAILPNYLWPYRKGGEFARIKKTMPVMDTDIFSGDNPITVKEG